MTMPYANATQCIALLFAKSGNPETLSGVTPWALEDEMLRYAAEHCMPGESEAAAITRLARTDDVAKALCRAAYHAEQLLQLTMNSEQQLAAFRKHLGADAAPAPPELGTADGAYSALERIAKAEAKPGEDFYTAFDRLSQTDADFQAGLRLYDRLHRR